MNTLFLLLAKYNSPRPSVEQLADFMNLSVATLQNRIDGKSTPFPVHKEGNNHHADLNDVAIYNDRMRNAGADARDAIARSLR